MRPVVCNITDRSAGREVFSVRTVRGICAIQEFVYPPYGTALIEAHNRRFEAVFVILHPFIRLPEQLAWSVTRRYPTDSEIVAEGSACTWTEVGRQTGLNSCARLNQALMTATGSLNGEPC